MEPVRAALRSRAPAWLVQMPGLLSAEERLSLQREVLGATRERMLREGCELFDALSAEAPLVVVLEDLHWSDYATLDLLTALARRRGPAALLVLASYRPSDAAFRDYPLQRLQQELQAHRLCTELSLDTFSPSELRAYLNSRFPGGGFPEAIAGILYQRTGGHPLFLVNLLDDLLAEGRIERNEGEWRIVGGGEDHLERGVPATIQALIEHQVMRLSPEEQRLLGVASAVGMESPAALLAAVLEQDSLAVEACCEHLAGHGPILAAAGVAEWPDGTMAGNYAFGHALYLEVLYRRLPPAYRVAVHRRLGERLELAYGERAWEIAAELARHFREGRDFPKATRYLRLAAEQAAARFANREALDYLGRALALVDRLPAETRTDARLALLHQCAVIHSALTDWPGVVAALETFVALARAHDRPADEIGGLIFLGMALFHSERSRCIAVMEQAVERSSGLADGRLVAYATAYRAYFRLDFGVWQAAERAAIGRGLAVASELSDNKNLATLRLMQTLLDLDRGDYAGALLGAREAAQRGLEMGDSFHRMAGQSCSAWALLGLGQWGELRAVLAAGFRVADQNGSPMVRSQFHLVAAALHLEAQDFPGALALCEQGRPVPGDAYTYPLYRVLLGQVYLGLGRYSEARRCLGELAEALEAGDVIKLRIRMMLHYGLGMYWLAQGKPRRASAAAERLLELAVPSGNCGQAALGYRILTEAALAEHDWEAAETQLSRALSAAEAAAVPLAAWRTQATAADLYARRGQNDRARAFRRKAGEGLARLAASLDGADPLVPSLRARASLFLDEAAAERTTHEREPFAVIPVHPLPAGGRQWPVHTVAARPPRGTGDERPLILG